MTEIEIFGDEKPVSAEFMANQQARIKAAGIEFRAFCNGLPLWISEDKHFDLWLMTDKEREEYLEKNSPYLKVSKERKVERVGGVRI